MSALPRDALIRYSRQIMLEPVGVAGQQRLNQATVLVIGLGGLGSPASLYLAACGVGRLVLADFDRVDLSNLQRQLLHGVADIGRPKTASAVDRLGALNPDIQLEPLEGQLDDAALATAIGRADVVLDCCDNFATRYRVNAACHLAGKPLVSAAAVRFEGQLAVFRHDLPGGPCYRCLYPEAGDGGDTCAAAGILSPVVGILGSMQALEAIKLILDIGEPASGKLLLFDALRNTWRSLALPADPACPVCGQETPT